MSDIYVNQLFGKKIADLEQSDLVDFFAEGQQETSVLEFKSAQIDPEKIYKEVAAFLNTDGGVLIIGAPQEITIDGVRVCKGALTDASSLRDKKQILQKIASHIVPSPVGIRVQEVSGAFGKQFILSIPQSEFAPHQCNDHKYYIRLDEESRSAPHGLIEAIFNRRQRPALSCDLSFFTSDDLTSDEIGLDISITNQSNVTARGVYLSLKVGQVLGIMGVEFTANPKYCDLNIVEVFQDNETPLVRGLHWNPKFQIRHFGKAFFVNIMYWCDGGNLRTTWAKFDPISKEVTLNEEQGHDDASFSIADEIRQAGVLPRGEDPEMLEEKETTWEAEGLELKWLIRRTKATFEGILINSSPYSYDSVDFRVSIYDKHGKCLQSEKKSKFDVERDSSSPIKIQLSKKSIYWMQKAVVEFVERGSRK